MTTTTSSLLSIRRPLSTSTEFPYCQMQISSAIRCRRLAANWPEDLVVAPIPGYSPQLGWKLTLVGGYFLGRDDADHEDDKPSVIGGMAMVSDNGSFAVGAGGYWHLFDDQLRVKAGAAYVDVNYRFYGIGNILGDRGVSIPLNQEIPLGFASASYRVWSKLYIGLGYARGSVDTRIRLDLNLPPEFPAFPAFGATVDIGAMELPLQFDTRDHEQFPSSGWLVDGRVMLYREDLGSDFEAETYKLSANYYHSIRDNDVLAFRAYARTTSGNAPFFLLSTFGGRTDLRGYATGRYRDRNMYAVQGEYRWVVNPRWIVTGFAGVGEVMSSWGDIGDNFLPAGGVGARFVLSQKHRVSLAADIGVGKNGTEFYFGINEAF